MPREARVNIKTRFIHLMVQGVNREYIFYSEEYKKKYLRLIQDRIPLDRIQMLAYCMMNNHAHFLFYVEDVGALSEFMKSVNCSYAQTYNKLENRCGILFRNRFQTEQIYDRKYLVNCIKYIHNNPVKAGIVKNCKDYKFSSYNDYISHTGLSRSSVIEEVFGKDCDFYNTFLQTYDLMFLDLEEDNNKIDDYIRESIRDYLREMKLDLISIFSEKEVFSKLLESLKEKYHFKYTDIMNFFYISRGVMNHIKYDGN